MPVHEEWLPGEEELVELLAVIYRQVDWRVQGGKNRLDRWVGQVRVAAVAGSLGEFVERLCTRLGVAYLPPVGVPLLDALRPHEGALLDLIWRETMPVAMRAYVATRPVASDEPEAEA